MSYFAALGTGCASGPPLLLGQPITKQVAVHVEVSKAAAHTDELGGIAALVEAVETGLKDRSVEYRLYTADDDHPAPPLIEIDVEQWDPGDREKRVSYQALGGLPGEIIAGQSSGFKVIVRYYREGDKQPSCERVHQGGLGTSLDDSASTGDSVGSHIVHEAMRGDAACGAGETGGVAATSHRAQP